MIVFFSVLFSLIPSNNILRVFLAKLNTLWFLLLYFVVFSMITNSSMNIRIDFYPLSLYMVFILIHNAFNHTLSSDWQIKYFRLKIEWNLSFEFPSLFLLRPFCFFHFGINKNHFHSLLMISDFDISLHNHGSDSLNKMKQ